MSDTHISLPSQMSLVRSMKVVMNIEKCQKNIFTKNVSLMKYITTVTHIASIFFTFFLSNSTFVLADRLSNRPPYCKKQNINRHRFGLYSTTTLQGQLSSALTGLQKDVFLLLAVSYISTVVSVGVELKYSCLAHLLLLYVFVLLKVWDEQGKWCTLHFPSQIGA